MGSLDNFYAEYVSATWMLIGYATHYSDSNRIRVLIRDYQNAKSTETMRDLTYYGDDNDIQLVFRAIRAWYPEFIAFACPFVVCTLVGPAAANVRLSNGTDSSHSKQNLNFNRNMLKLVLERVGNFWEIGSCALSKSIDL